MVEISVLTAARPTPGTRCLIVEILVSTPARPTPDEMSDGRDLHPYAVAPFPGMRQLTEETLMLFRSTTAAPRVSTPA
jgi:hypothetical protein